MADIRSTEATPLWFFEPTFGARFVAAFVDGFLLISLTAAPIAVYLGVLRGPLHRGLHDHAAGTVVTADAVEV